MQVMILLPIEIPPQGFPRESQSPCTSQSCLSILFGVPGNPFFVDYQIVTIIIAVRFGGKIIPTSHHIFSAKPPWNFVSNLCKREIRPARVELVCLYCSYKSMMVLSLGPKSKSYISGVSRMECRCQKTAFFYSQLIRPWPHGYARAAYGWSWRHSVAASTSQDQLSLSGRISTRWS